MSLTILEGLNNTGFEDLFEFIYHSIDLVITFSALLAVAFLIYAGFKYILSAGDENKSAEAQKTIIYTLIGLVICFISPMVIRFIVSNLLT